MANLTDIAKSTNTFHYTGALAEKKRVKAPTTRTLMGMGKIAFTNKREFSQNTNYELDEASGAGTSEDASLNPQIRTFVRAQEKNITQIFSVVASATRRRLANQDELVSIASFGAQNLTGDEMDFQIETNIAQEMRNLNKAILTNTFSDGGLTDPSVADQTRGISASIDGANVVDATGLDFSDPAVVIDALDTMFKLVHDNGEWGEMMIIANSTNIALIDKAYPQLGLLEIDRDRFVAGAVANRITTRYGDVFTMIDNDLGDEEILMVDLEGVQVVFTQQTARADEEVRDNWLVLKTLSQAGGEKTEIYFEAGINVGASWLHGKITNIGA